MRFGKAQGRDADKNAGQPTDQQRPLPDLSRESRNIKAMAKAKIVIGRKPRPASVVLKPRTPLHKLLTKEKEADHRPEKQEACEISTGTAPIAEQ